MSVRLAKAALALYPLAYRRRYGEEMQALVEETQPRIRDTLDLLRGALKAHTRPQGGVLAALDPEDRLRSNVSGIIACWIVFAIADLAFLLMTADRSFSKMADTHPFLGGSHHTIVFLASPVTFGGLLAAFVIALLAEERTQARRTSGHAVEFFRGWMALLLLVMIPMAVVLLEAPHLSHLSFGSFLSSATLCSLAMGVILVCTTRFFAFIDELADRDELADSSEPAESFPTRALVFALGFGALAAVAMGLTAVAACVYLGALIQHSLALTGQGDGPLGSLGTVALIGIQFAAMVVAAALAAVATKRAWSSYRAAPSPFPPRVL